MFGRFGKWLVVATAGLLAVGLVGLGVAYAQGPNPARTPQADCPAAPQAGPGLHMGWRWGGDKLQTWADALGMKVEDVTAALRDGKTMADLAAERGIEVEDLVAKAVAARKAVVQEAVEAGRLTQEQADAMLEQMQERMTENLQNGTCAPGTGHGRWGTDAQPQDGRQGGRGRGRWGAGDQPQGRRQGGTGRGPCAAALQQPEA